MLGEGHVRGVDRAVEFEGGFLDAVVVDLINFVPKRRPVLQPRPRPHLLLVLDIAGQKHYNMRRQPPGIRILPDYLLAAVPAALFDLLELAVDTTVEHVVELVVHLHDLGVVDVEELALGHVNIRHTRYIRLLILKRVRLDLLIL